MRMAVSGGRGEDVWRAGGADRTGELDVSGRGPE